MSVTKRTSQLSKSPSGSLFPYFYKGGELHCFKYGSFYKDERRLFQRMDEEEEFFLLSKRRMNSWVDLYETRLTRDVIERLVLSIDAVSPLIERIALVGKIGFFSRRRILRDLKVKKVLPRTQVRFYTDPEVAKTWIVTGE